MQLTELPSTAQALLEAFAKELISLDPEFNLPDYQYVGTGEIAWDCPALVVYCGPITLGKPGAPDGQATYIDSTMIYATLYVELIRAVATEGYYGTAFGESNVPDVADLNDDGMQAVKDAAFLMQAANNIKAQQTIVSKAIASTSQTVVPVGPQGGLAASRLTFEFAVA
jgi:hypothetical protein